MKIRIEFPAGQVATLEHGEWQCNDRTLLAICRMPPRRRPAEIAPATLVRSVMLLAGRMGAKVKIEAGPGTSQDQ